MAFPIEKSSHEVKDWSLGEQLTLVFAQLEGERGVDSKQRSFSMVWGRAETDLELKRGNIL